MAPGPQVLLADLPAAIRHSGPAAPEPELEWTRALAEWARRQLESGSPELLASAKRTLERVLFEEALKHSGGDRQQAARRLGCGRNTLTRKLGPKRR
jgi:two-component system nitrogen regulation response regulator GlnG